MLIAIIRLKAINLIQNVCLFAKLTIFQNIGKLLSLLFDFFYQIKSLFSATIDFFCIMSIGIHHNIQAR